MSLAAPYVVLAFMLTISAAQGQSSSSVCTNGCEFASDGDCDDGGAGSEFSACSCGNDCNDCGTRVCFGLPPPPSPSPPPPCQAYGSNRCNRNATSASRKGGSSYSSGGDDPVLIPFLWLYIGPGIAVLILYASCRRVSVQAKRNQTTRFEVIRSFTRPRAHGQHMATPPQNVPQAIPQATPGIQMDVPTAVPVGGVAVPMGGVTVTEASPALAQSNPTEELERLASLHTSGMLSDAEFEQAKVGVHVERTLTLTLTLTPTLTLTLTSSAPHSPRSSTPSSARASTRRPSRTRSRRAAR